MKASGPLVASVLAASTVAFTSSSSAGDHSTSVSHYSGQGCSSTMKNSGSKSCTASDKEKFVPRFDGLRFIETLVTAHR